MAKVGKQFVLVTLLVGSLYGGLTWVKWNTDCVRDFSAFAYQQPSVLMGRWLGLSDLRSPGSDWANVEIETDLPLTYVSLIRSHMNAEEIWIRSQHEEDFDTEEQHEQGFLIFTPSQNSSEFISQFVTGSPFFVDTLYVDLNGGVWGRTRWNDQNVLMDYDSVSPLMRFNEVSRRFELLSELAVIPSASITRQMANPINVVVDEFGVFWIFVDYIGLYRYSPDEASLSLVYELQEEILDVTLANDDVIYFTVYNAQNSFMYFSGKSLYRFSLSGEQPTLVEYPEYTYDWPAFSGLLFDKSGRLWFGAVAYLTPAGEWHLINSQYRQGYSENLGHPRWFSPEVFLESSNGRIWFRKFVDMGDTVDGVGWYDPDSGDGCQITDTYTNITEDSVGDLWMVTDGKLYSRNQ
jgi:hypothetical protein